MNTPFCLGPTSPTRYSTVAILLHWVIALMVLSMVPIGWWMVRAIEVQESRHLAYQLFQIHKSIGFAILVFSVMRLVWRLTHPTPALPSGMKSWEVFLARTTHTIFYGLMIAIPFTGWIYVSTGWTISTDRPLDVATSWFGLISVPHLPGLVGQRMVTYTAMGAHTYLAWGGVILVALHIAAAFKHHLMDRDGVLAQMVPFLRLRTPSHRPIKPQAHLGSGLAIVSGLAVVLTVAMIGAWLNMPRALPPQPRETTVAASEAAPAAVVQTPGVTAAPAWTINQLSSSISFSGSHAGKAFNGRFGEWAGQVNFDPGNLAGSKAVIIVKTSSASTGDGTQEGSLKNGEWFNSIRFPDAKFETTAFRALDADRYEAHGTLTIKNKSIPVVLPFSLTIDGKTANVEAGLELHRATLNLGMFSDPAAEWVSKVILVKIVVHAEKTAP